MKTLATWLGWLALACVLLAVFVNADIMGRISMVVVGVVVYIANKRFDARRRKVFGPRRPTHDEQRPG